MKTRPTVFISGVSREFAGFRDAVENEVEMKGCFAENQPGFPPDYRAVEAMLTDKIKDCDIVICVVGFCFGAEPNQRPAGAPRRSYTQMEWDIANRLGKPVYRFLSATPDVRDRMTDEDIRGAAKDDDEAKALQLGHRKAVTGGNGLYYTFKDKAELCKLVAEIPIIRDQPFTAAPSKLPKRHDDGVFEGRDQVLADLDALWAAAMKDAPGRARIVSLVAIGGAGKTTVASRWKNQLLGRDGHGGVERYFDWSFYSQGVRREGAGAQAGAQSAADATVFIAAALKFFGDADDIVLADSPAPAWDKGARLAELVARHRTLLILDGLEPLQHPPGPQSGELKDDAIRALFEGLKTNGHGLCVVTTRERVADLAATEKTTTPQWPLDHLTDVAGAAVLREHKVTGPQEELEAASRGVKGHALTLSLMGRFLNLAYDPPDIARRDCFRFEDASLEFGEVRDGMGHAFRVFAAYERWFEKEGRLVELAILRLLGLFDRPATPDCLAALCAEPALPGLTEPLVGLGEREWTLALNRLRQINLVETVDWSPTPVRGYGEKEAQAEMVLGRQGKTNSKALGSPQPFPIPHSALPIPHSLDAHPLLREYFDAQLKKRDVAPAAHGRLYEHLCGSVPCWPEGREGLLPLYQAVAHGCKAGRYQDACDDVYFDRILRGTAGAHAAYSTFKLGLLGLDLGAVACFFVEPWRQLAPELKPAAQSWLLSEAAFRLRALNRLAEAREAFRTNLEVRVHGKDSANALAIAASNLSQLELTLGDVSAAEATAARSVDFADRSGDAFQRMCMRTTHADALHQAGRREESRVLSEEAEAMEKERQPEYPLLYSLRGYQYCDLLLSDAERDAWRRFVGMSSDDEDASSLSGTRESGPPEGGKPNEELAAIERRAGQTHEWVTPQRWLLDIALDHLTLGRVHLLRAVLEDSPIRKPHPAIEHLGTALAKLRDSNNNDDIPRALLPCAWMHAAAGEWDMARRRLDEAFSIATRGGNREKGWVGGMRLHLVDTLLHRARIFGNRNPAYRFPGEYPWKERSPEADLVEAAALIEACGYHRRDEELADARRAILGQV